jgi:hypothetical protein
MITLQKSFAFNDKILEGISAKMDSFLLLLKTNDFQ